MACWSLKKWWRMLTKQPLDSPASTDGDAHQRSDATSPDTPSAPVPEQRPVLVVDDQRTNQTLLVLQLRAVGYASETAGTVAQALDKWHSKRYAAIITDCNMAGLSGYDLARTIRRIEAEEKRPRTPVIGWSANAQEDGAEACLEAGMDAYLQKCADADALAHMLARWVSSPSRPTVRDKSRQAAQRASLAILDRSVLERYSDGDASLERQILREYRGANIVELEAVRHAFAEQDAELLGQTCHRLKGASRIIGAHAFAAVCERMEQQARSADWIAIAAEMDGLFDESRRLEDALEID